MSAYTPGYEVLPDGRVFSSLNWRGYGRREMQQTLNADGYPSVRILIDGRRKRIAVHRLVAQQFLPPKPSPTHEIRHLDGSKTNSAVWNLAWGTQKDNAEDRQRHGRTSRGASHGEAVKRGLPNPAPNKGRPLTVEHRRRIGDAMRGKPWTEARRVACVH